MTRPFKLLDKLEEQRSLSLSEYQEILDDYKILQAYAQEKAVSIRKKIYSNHVYIRGLLEISNYCRNDCYYCGIRASNSKSQRYRLEEEEIINLCNYGYDLGFRTIVLQSGEDPYFSTDIVARIIQRVKLQHEDLRITLSLGERSYEDYKIMFDAGADRYLLRHETFDVDHYNKIHPKNMPLDKRVKCLKNLKDIGYASGIGFMVGSPYQNTSTLAKDLKFYEEFQPEMCGIGPFISHKNTPFKDMDNGSKDLTLYLLSLLRIIKPNILLPATTALGTIDKNGTYEGILAGANVIMPNITPMLERKKYSLYDKKLITGTESASNLKEIDENLRKIGYKILISQGDMKS